MLCDLPETVNFPIWSHCSIHCDHKIKKSRRPRKIKVKPTILCLLRDNIRGRGSKESRKETAMNHRKRELTETWLLWFEVNRWKEIIGWWWHQYSPKKKRVWFRSYPETDPSPLTLKPHSFSLYSVTAYIAIYAFFYMLRSQNNLVGSSNYRIDT